MGLLIPNWITLSVVLIITIFYFPITNAQTIETYVVPPLNFTDVVALFNYSGVIPAANYSRNITSSIPDSAFELQYYRFSMPPSIQGVNISMYNVVSNTNESCDSLRIFVSGIGFPCSSLKYPFTEGYVCSLNSVQWSALRGINTTFGLHAGFHETIWRPGEYLYIGIGRETASSASANCSFSLYVTAKGCANALVASGNVFDYSCFPAVPIPPNTTFNATTIAPATVYQVNPDIPSNVITSQIIFTVTTTVNELVNAYGRNLAVGDYLMHDCSTNSSTFDVVGSTARSNFSCFAPPPGRFFINLVRKYATSVYTYNVKYTTVVCPNGTLGKNCEFNYTTIQWPTNGSVYYEVDISPTVIPVESWAYWRFDEPSNPQLEIEFIATLKRGNVSMLPYMYLKRGTFPYSGRGGFFGGFDWTPRMIGSQNATYVLKSQDLFVGGSYFLGILNNGPSNITITLTGTRKVPSVSFSSTTGTPDLHSDSSAGRVWITIWSIIGIVLSVIIV